MKTLINLLLSGILILGIMPNMNAQNLNEEEIKAKKEAFNFWIGEWDVYKYSTDTLVGRSSIQSILNGNAIQEHYEATQSSYKGTSLNKYNLSSGQWEQYWVDNGGLTLHIKGGIRDGKMVMKNVMNLGKGDIENRIVWYRDTPITVRQIWSQKKPEEESWKVVFDGSYQMRVENK